MMCLVELVGGPLCGEKITISMTTMTYYVERQIGQASKRTYGEHDKIDPLPIILRGCYIVEVGRKKALYDYAHSTI
jgi:hypothetical protein